MFCFVVDVWYHAAALLTTDTCYSDSVTDSSILTANSKQHMRASLVKRFQFAKQLFVGGSAAVLLLMGSPAGAAQPGKWNFQVYGGWYAAGDLQALNDVDGSLGDTLEALGLEPGDDITWGARVGKRHSDNWGWEISLGFFDIDEAAERLENRSGINFGLGLVDLSAMYYPGGGDFFLYGGIGSAQVDLEIASNGKTVLDNSSSEISGNLGLGYVWNVGETTFIRLDGKFRFYDSDYYSGPDGEATVGLGWNF
mgnify:CR=1 FL=1